MVVAHQGQTRGAVGLIHPLSHQWASSEVTRSSAVVAGVHLTLSVCERHQGRKRVCPEPAAELVGSTPIFEHSANGSTQASSALPLVFGAQRPV